MKIEPSGVCIERGREKVSKGDKGSPAVDIQRERDAELWENVGEEQLIKNTKGT